MSPIKMEKVEKANRLVLRYIEAINDQQLGTIENLLNSECVWETSIKAPEYNRIIGRKNIMEYWKNKFEDGFKYSIKVEEIMGLGIRCIIFEHIEKENSEGQYIISREVEIFEVKGEEIIKIRSYAKI